MKSFVAGIFLPLIVLIILPGCEQPTAADNGPAKLIKDKDGRIIEGEYKKYNAKGKLAAVMHFKDKVLHGPATKYYADGKTVRSELNYEQGQLQGIQKRYYESGKLYKEEMFVNGKRHGLTKKYRESGMLMTEAMYKNGFAGTDLKEYLTNGKLKKKYPKIIVKEEDRLTLNGTYTVKVYLSDKSKKVKYYLGKLDEGKFLHDKLEQQHNVNQGILTYTFHLRPGEFLMQELDIVARVPTRLNNTFVTTRKYRLGIEFPLY